jgi:hypothetical protein
VDGEELGERLLRVADSLRPFIHPGRDLPTEWASLGISVSARPMRARGSCSTGSGSRAVFVNAHDPRALQRFTIAHELAHLLLRTPEEQAKPISPRHEEVLCERFAGRLLIDDAVLVERLSALRQAPGPEDVLRLCGEFEVNIRPMLIAIGRHLADSDHLLLLSRRRGHPRRPEEIAFRVESFAGARHAFLPRHQRLFTLGLRRLAAAGEEARHNESFVGADRTVEVGLRGLPGPRSSATVARSLDWSAVRLGNEFPLLLVRLDLDVA